MMEKDFRIIKTKEELYDVQLIRTKSLKIEIDYDGDGIILSKSTVTNTDGDSTDTYHVWIGDIFVNEFSTLYQAKEAVIKILENRTYEKSSVDLHLEKQLKKFKRATYFKIAILIITLATAMTVFFQLINK